MKHLPINKTVMKKLSIMLVCALFAYTTSATAQTVKQTTTKTTKQTKTQTGKTVAKPAPINTQEYSTAHKSPIDSYKDETANDQQGASADNGEESVTIIQRDKGTTDKTTATKTGTKKTTGAQRKVVKP
jgi:sensor histidine kinase regulating citrate/malate metabolism